jgi:putative transposase
MQITYKYRLFPTNAQRTALEKTLAVCRFVYNETLATRKQAWEQQEQSISLYDSNKLLTTWKADKPFLIAVHSQVLQNVQERVELAFKAFFRRVKAGEEAVGYPRFKGYGYYDSFTFKQYGFKLDGDRLKLSKIGSVGYCLLHSETVMCAALTSTPTFKQNLASAALACKLGYQVEQELSVVAWCKFDP